MEQEQPKAEVAIKVNKHIAFETKDAQVKRFDRMITRDEEKCNKKTKKLKT